MTKSHCLKLFIRFRCEADISASARFDLRPGHSDVFLHMKALELRLWYIRISAFLCLLTQTPELQAQCLRRECSKCSE